jgi:hypothetical protein
VEPLGDGSLHAQLVIQFSVDLRRFLRVAILHHSGFGGGNERANRSYPSFAETVCETQCLDRKIPRLEICGNRSSGYGPMDTDSHVPIVAKTIRHSTIWRTAIEQ